MLILIECFYSNLYFLGFSRHVAHLNPTSIVYGIDITPEYIDVCNALIDMTNVRNVSYSVENATEIKVENNSFDIACLLHVGMNIQDKDKLFRELYRVLDSGGTFAVYDLMRTGNKQSPILFPVPWAVKSSQSFVCSPSEYVVSARNAKFDLVQQTSYRDMALKFFEPLLKRLKNNLKMPPYSMSLLIGEKHAEEKMQNVINMIENDVICPVELIFRKN